MGYEPILNLAATPDEAVSIICTIVDKTIPSTFWEKLMYASYTTDRPRSSVGHPIGALGLICLWVLLTWLTYAYGMLSQDDFASGEFSLLQCACQLFGLGTSTHVCL
jgi:hypothetical protein